MRSIRTRVIVGDPLYRTLRLRIYDWLLFRIWIHVLGTEVHVVLGIRLFRTWKKDIGHVKQSRCYFP